MLTNIFKGEEQLRNRILTSLLILLLLFSILGVTYIAAVPGISNNSYTEFYVLGSEGRASGYPTNLTAGESGEFIIGITNNEHQDMTYTIRIVQDEELIEERSVEVTDQNTWEDEFQFRLTEEGTHKLEILLFVGNSTESSDEPYRDLHLWVTITDEGIDIQDPREIPQSNSSNESI